jgi:hypothetical protein
MSQLTQLLYGTTTKSRLSISFGFAPRMDFAIFNVLTEMPISSASLFNSVHCEKIGIDISIVFGYNIIRNIQIAILGRFIYDSR